MPENQILRDAYNAPTLAGLLVGLMAIAIAAVWSRLTGYYLPRWLDRIWLVVIALSFALLVPIWFILSVQRMGLPFVIACIVITLVSRYSVTPTDPCTRR